MGLLPHTAALPWGSGQWNSCYTLAHSLVAVGSGIVTTHCTTALGQWAVELLLHTRGRSRGRGPRPLGAHCHMTLAQWAVELLHYTASLPGGNGQWDSGNYVPHCFGAVGTGTLAAHCPTTRG